MRVLVVGASPAGLAAARAAAEAGARVHVLDARAEIGVPEPPAVVAFDFLWSARERPTDDVVRRRLCGVRFASPLDASRALEVEAPLSVLDRTKFDQGLAKKARDAGARIELGVAGLRARSDRSLVDERGSEHRADVVVFADGAHSLARVFLQPVRDPDALTWGAALAFDDARDDDFATLKVGSHAPGGRSQLNPLGHGKWAHWTFYKGHRDEAERRARAALALDVNERVARSATLTAIAPDPVFTIPRELAAPGVMVVGGAAGQGGIELGVASGELAGGFAAQGDSRGYEKAWKRAYLGGYKSLRRANARLARLSDAHLDRLISPWSGWRLPVRDVVGLAHASAARRAEAIAKLAARNPWALAPSALVGLRSLVPLTAGK